jgi:apolipoprotein N-acyltransferase
MTAEVRLAARTAAVLALLAGGLQALASSLTEPSALLQGGAMTMLAVLLGSASPRQAAARGFLFGLASTGGGLWWIYISLHEYGHLPGWAAAAAVLALSAFMALFSVVTAVGFALSRGHSTSPLMRVLLFAAWWLIGELLCGSVLGGFPWLVAGHAHANSLLTPWAAWIGVPGIGFGAAALAAAVAESVVGRRPQPVLALPLLLVLIGQGLPQDFTRPVGSLQVALLQGNVAQDEKFDRTRLWSDLEWYGAAISRVKTDLIITPETAVPLLPDSLPSAYWDEIRAGIRHNGAHVLIGLPLGDARQGYTNSVIGLSHAASGAEDYRYDKYHLLPFGEFVPSGFRWFVDLLQIPLGDFGRGRVDAPSFAIGTQRVAPSICVENLYGEELAQRFGADESADPTLLATLSNLGWFGRSSAADQHLQIARMRSLELQRPILTAANTGVTAIIDHRGQVLARLPQFRREVLTGQIEGRSGRTPYATWVARFGLWPLWFLATLLILGVWQRGQSGPDPCCRA